MGRACRGLWRTSCMPALEALPIKHQRNAGSGAVYRWSKSAKTGLLAGCWPVRKALLNPDAISVGAQGALSIKLPNDRLQQAYNVLLKQTYLQCECGAGVC